MMSPTRLVVRAVASAEAWTSRRVRRRLSAAKHEGAHDAEGGCLGGGGHSPVDGAEDDEDQDQRRHEIGEAPEPLPPARRGRRGGGPAHDEPVAEDERHEERGDQGPRQEPGHVELADRGLGDQPVDDEGDAGRDEVAEGAPRGQRAQDHPRAVACLLEVGQGHRADGGGGGHARPGDGREDRARDDVGVQEPARQSAEPEVEGAVELIGQTGAEQDLAHQDEQGHRHQHEVDARNPDGLPDEEIQRPVGEDHAGEEAEHAERGRHVDARAEEHEEHQGQGGEGDHRPRARPAAREQKAHRQQDDQEGDRDHRWAPRRRAGHPAPGQTHCLQRVRRLLGGRPRPEETVDGARAPPPEEQDDLEQHHHPQGQEHGETDRPQPLRDHEGNRQGAGVAGPELPGLRHHRPPPPREEEREDDEEGEGEPVHPRAEGDRHPAEQHVDADVRALGEGVGQPPADPERQQVAGDLGGALRADPDQLAAEHVDGDEQGARRRRPSPPPRS